MGKKTRVVILTVTVVLTLFTFVAMYLTRPGHSDWAKKVLEEAAARQGQSLVSVKEPLETDTKVLSEEEKMAEKVAAILSDDSSFNDKVKANIADDIIDELEAWKKGVEEDIEKDVEEYLSNYSLDEYIPVLKAEINNTINARMSELNAAIESKIVNIEENSSYYTDSSIKKIRVEMKNSDDSLRALIESSIDTEEIARTAMANLGISEDEEYRGAVERLVDEVIKALLSNKEVEDSTKTLIRSEETSSESEQTSTKSEQASTKSEQTSAKSEQTSAKSEQTSAKSEQTSAKSEQTSTKSDEKASETSPATSVTSSKKPISVPVFSSQRQYMTQEEYIAKRSKLRNNVSDSVEEWTATN